ncbi:hypothetical protein LSCM1_06312 [Leishmania martiniquensis]|uniref:Glycerol uptake protein n=1 Tax=Leishmania martiniquensis TaxID=1580590 RepID=A0A836KWH0_9TRYP|nr:hypothetical protein LSCM1_06312 [Leishmania martiniquensis]
MEVDSLRTSPKEYGAPFLRPWAAGTAATATLTGSTPTRSISEGTGNAGGGKNDDMDIVLPLSRAAAADATSSTSHTYLSRTSLEYIASVVSVIAILLTVCLYPLYRVGSGHHEELKANLRPPWALYRWLGSTGVDVTDLQLYYFVVAVPPALPYLMLFLMISRRLRRTAASKQAAIVREAIPNSSGDGKELGSLASGTHHTENVTCDGTNDSGTFGPLPPALKDMSALQVHHIISGMLIALCLCGPGFLFGVALMLFNFYLIAPLYKRVSFRASMAVMWVWHVSVLFLNFYSHGYRFGWFGLGFLDNLWTPLIGWSTQYNMSVLRMISFNNDLWESASCGEERRQRSLARHARTCIACAQIRDQQRHLAASLPPEALSCYKCRTECPRHVEEFTLTAYLGYILYLPLFMAGPLSSFNAYVSYQHHRAKSMSSTALWRYGFRFLCHTTLLVTLLHYVPIMAMLLTPAAAPTEGAASGAVKVRAAPSVPGPTGPLTITTGAMAMSAERSPAWGEMRNIASAVNATTTAAAATATRSVLEQMTLEEKSSLFFFSLAFLWLKFSVIWRFFRFCALLDGFDPPEDMPRCFANAVSIQSFWRDWHASFNLWIVRYMYIPMGGSRTKLLSILPIFFFIAIWHDIELRLLFWAVIICLTFMTEIVVTQFFSSKNPLALRLKRSPLVWRYLRVFGAQLGLIELAVANAIGFSIGAKGAVLTVHQLIDNTSLLYTAVMTFFFLCIGIIAVQHRDQRAYEEQQLKIKYDLR